MPEQLLSPFVTSDRTKFFKKSVTKSIFRGSKLRAKFKQLKCALSVKKKSINRRSYSSIMCKEEKIGHSQHSLLATRDSKSEPSGGPMNSLSLTNTNVPDTLDNVATGTESYSQTGNSCVQQRPLSIQHDSVDICVVEFFPETPTEGFSSTQAINIDETPSDSKHPMPDVFRGLALKRDLNMDPSHFENLDSHAIQVAKRDYNNTDELLRDLTTNCNSELDTVRVLFRWVIARGQKNARDRHRRRSNVIGLGDIQYQSLFHSLCRQAGLHSEIILGYSKGAGHRPGMCLDTSHRNSWNAVAIDGTWRFINCTWAARHMTANLKKSSHLRHKYDEFYFLTDPKEHIYQHFPDDPKWQLLDQPLSLGEFTKLPSVKSPFFKHGLQFSCTTPAILETKNNSVEVKFQAPDRLEIGSRLEIYESPREQVTNHVLHRRIGSEIILTVLPPHPGSYSLSVYAGSSCTSDVLECVFSLRIVLSSDSVETEPQNPTAYLPVSTLGPTPLMSTLGVSTNTHHDPLINMVDNTIQIDFNVTDHVKFTHTLQYYDSTGDTLVDIDRYAFARHRTDSELSFSVACPRKGSYIFCLYGATCDSTTYDCLFQYLLVCPSDNLSCLSFPKSYNSWRDSSLASPLNGQLVQDMMYTFSVSVRDAANVIVVVGLKKHSLVKLKNNKWTGNVSTGDASPRATVIAGFTSNTGHSYFARLLEYDIL